MKTLYLTGAILLGSMIIMAQNVGIGTSTPAEKLDVNGNVNITGTLKADGVAGTQGQVLGINTIGNLEWINLCQYKNFEVFQATSSGAVQTFTVPAGVTRILCEVWGGGGRGATSSNGGSGGGGGGYITGYFDVTPGDAVSVTVGLGASGAITNGESSRVDAGAQSIIAFGGISASATHVGTGGVFLVFSTTNYYGRQGGHGKPTTVKYDQISATEFAKATYYGNGGNAANTISTGGQGGFNYTNVNTAVVISNTNGLDGRIPGGGGPAASTNNSGAPGMVIIRY